jgi:hypothetical protein
MGVACELLVGDFSVTQEAAAGIAHRAVDVTSTQLSRSIVTGGGRGRNSKKNYRWKMLHSWVVGSEALLGLGHSRRAMPRTNSAQIMGEVEIPEALQMGRLLRARRERPRCCGDAV